MHSDSDKNIDDIAAAIESSRSAAAAGRAGGGIQLSEEEIASSALSVVLDRLGFYTDEQIASIYELLVGEIAHRNLEEEIMGESQDSSSISIEEEMGELIKMVRNMRANLGRQAAAGKQVANREIRETLNACVTAIKTLTTHQKSVRTLERSRVLESVLIEVLGELSDQVQSDFKARFRERLEEVGE